MLKDDTELALDVISDLILNPTFPEEELVKEREVVVQEIKQTIDSPDDIIFDYFRGKPFPTSRWAEAFSDRPKRFVPSTDRLCKII